MRFRVTAALIAASALALPGPARAVPYAGVLHKFQTTVHIMGSDRYLYLVTLTVTVSTPASSQQISTAVIGIAPCSRYSCGDPDHYSKQLTGAEITLSTNMSSATLRTTFGGRPLEAAWANAATVPTNNRTTVNNTNDAVVGAGSTADATLRIFDVQCRTTNSTVETDFWLMTGGRSDGTGLWPTAPPRGFGRTRRRRPSCAHVT